MANPSRLAKDRLIRYGARLSHDGEVLYYPGRDNLRALSLEEGGDYAVTDLVGRRGTLGWGVATDGYYLYFTWSEQTGDLWVMDAADPR